jgi:hypothetical protein
MSMVLTVNSAHTFIFNFNVAYTFVYGPDSLRLSCIYTFASFLARVKCRGGARRRFMQFMKSLTGLPLKRVVTSIILLA